VSLLPEDLLAAAASEGRKAVDVIRRPWTVAGGVHLSIVAHARLAAHYALKATDPTHEWGVVAPSRVADAA
jgi:hypothetical protein